MAGPSPDAPSRRSAPAMRPGGISRALRRALFGLAPDEARFAKRGFRGAGGPACERLERIGATFIHGYNAALETPRPEELLPALEEVALELRGFAYEGAAMALELLDTLAPWGRPRVRAFLDAGAHAHVYMVHVGMGWAWARLRRSVPRRLARVDPLLGWLAVDGYGFHEGFFHPARYVDRQEPPRLEGYAARAFDQGLGRSLWFVEGAGVERILARLRDFPAGRLPDLWAGLGLACTYAGGVERAALEQLREAAGPCLPQLAQGAVFAARARQRAGNLAPHNTLACEVLCEAPAERTAALAEAALADAGSEEGTPPRFERWRQRIQRDVLSPVRARSA